MTRVIVLAALFVCCFPLLLDAQTREMITTGKQATALIELEQKGRTATAFCIHESGIFVTNQHVVAKLPDATLVKLVLNPNLQSERVVKAKVLRADADIDLAVLKAEGTEKFTFLQLGDEAELVETQEITAFGFPFGKSLAVNDTSYPDISVNIGRITALRMREGKLNQIQLDAQLNPGNSGGPVLDRSGKVIGIATAGVFTTGVNFAVPVTALKKLVERPEVIFTPPTITTANQHEEAAFRVQVVPFLGELKSPSLELELVTSAETRKVQFAAKDGEFIAKAIPMPRAVTNEEVRIGVKLSFLGGSVTGEVVDREIRVGDAKLKLSDLRSLDRTKDNLLVKEDGSTMVGTAIDLSELDVDVGGSTVRVEFDKAKQVAFHPQRAPTSSVTYTLVVKNGSSVLHRSSGKLLRGTDAASIGQTTRFVPYKGQKQSLLLPGTVSDVCLAKGGSLILFYMPKLRKIAVYDVNTATIAREIQVGADEILMAAGLEKLIIVTPSMNLLERWSLDTLERETSKTFPGVVVKNISLGYASQGPLLMLEAANTEALSRCNYNFYDLDKLTALNVGEFRGHNNSYRDAVHIRASATGEVFGLWATSHSPQGMETMLFLGNQVKVAYQHSSAGHLVPNFDGTAIVTATAGVCSPELSSRPSNSRTKTMPAVPTTHPRFYLTVPVAPAAQMNVGTDPYKGQRGAVRLIDGTADLISLPDLELGTGEADTGWGRHDFTIEKRVFYIPQANQLITVPFSNDKLIVQRLSLSEALEAASTAYLFVSSSAPPTFVRGQTYRYQVHVDCNTRGASVELTSGPDTMAVSPTGELVWTVPADFEKKEIQCVLSIKATDGRTTNHTFKLRESAVP